MSRSLVLSLVALVLVPACNEDEPSIHDRVSDYAAEINAQIDIYCDCWEEMAYGSRSECVDAYGFLGPSRQACYEDALSRDEAAASSWLDCVIQLERNYTACVDQRLTCDDFSSADACLSDWEIGYDSCIQLPESVVRGLEDCDA
jgi:hypothetical protein